MDFVTDALVERLHPNQTGGIFKYISDVINGSCYSCLFQSSTWTKYAEGLNQINSSKSYIILFTVLIGILVLLVSVILILILIFIRRTKKPHYISTVPNYLYLILIVSGIVLLSGFFQISMLAQTFNKPQSMYTITNKTFYSIELFANQTLITFPQKIDVSLIINATFTQVTFTIKTIISSLMKQMNVDHLLIEGPKLIEDLISVNESFSKIYFYQKNHYQNISNFAAKIKMFFQYISLLEENSFTNHNASERVRVLILKHNLMNTDSNINFDNSAFLGTIQKLIPDMSLQKIKVEVDKIIFDMNKVVPESLQDIEKEIQRDLIFNKTENLFKFMSGTSITIHGKFTEVLVMMNYYEPNLYRIEGFFIVWTTLLHFFFYPIFLVLVIKEKYKRRIHILNIVISFLTLFIAIFTIICFVMFAYGSNEVFRYFQQSNESLVLDQIISQNSDHLWQNLLILVKEVSGDFWPILTLPKNLPTFILKDIRMNCYENESILSILGFSSIFNFDYLEEIPMFQNLISESRIKAKQKIVEEIKKINIPKIDPQIKDLAENTLKKFLNSKESQENFNNIDGIFKYFNWVKSLTIELESLISPNEKIKIILKEIENDLPRKIKIVKDISKSFKVILVNSNISETFTTIFNQSQISASSIENITEVQTAFVNIFDQEIKNLVQKLFLVYKRIYQKDILGNIASCSLFNNIFQNLYLYFTFTIALMSTLFCVYLQTVIFSIFVIIFYGHFLKIICSKIL